MRNNQGTKVELNIKEAATASTQNVAVIKAAAVVLY